MIITKTETIRTGFHKDGIGDKKHIEKHIVTTYWFLFIPVFRYKKLHSTNF